MKSFKSRSIKHKLILINLITTIVGLILACLIFIRFDMINFRNGLVRELEILAEIIGSNSTAALVFQDHKTAQEVLSTSSVKKHLEAAGIYDASGKLFTSYCRSDGSHPFPISVNVSEPQFHKNYLTLFQGIILDDEQIGIIYLNYDLDEIGERLRLYAGIVTLVFIIAVSASFLVISRLQTVIAEPILHLSEIAKNVTYERDYSVRAVRRTEDELGLLINAFNDMLSQIQERDEELLKNQEHLERRVDERTQALKLEIDERKKIESHIKTSLKEKEVLLKEIHHRVKNNLQVVSSLLYLQSKKTENKVTLEMLNESQNRIKSMALIHEKLYQSDDIIHVDFSNYVESLVSHLSRSYTHQIHGVNISVQVKDVLLDIDKAIPCGLIINELVSNSIKYAFPDNKRGKIYVQVSAENHHVDLIIGDNGVGFPEDIDIDKTGTLGLQLVSALTKQLKGRFDLDRSGGEGTRFKITFNVSS